MAVEALPRASSSAPRRTPVKWPGSEDVAALIGLVLFLAAQVTIGMVPHISPVLQLAVLGVLLVVGVIVPLLHRLRLGGDVSFYLLVPTIMSATQNVYLLPTAKEIGKGELQVFIVSNFLIAVLTLAALWMFHPAGTGPGDLREVRLTALLLTALTGWGFTTVVLFHTAPTAAFASFRNFSTPMLFLLLGLLASRASLATRYAGHLVRLGMVVVVFGFFERFSSFWTSVPLADLEGKKNLPISPDTGLPPNYFSSETLGGVQLRRMVSSFADPVNLGTFLFVVFVAAWFLDRRAATVLSVIACLFAISKGALIGFLVFAFFRTRFLQAPTAAFLSAAGAGTLSLGFYVFSASHSTGSAAAHVKGLTGALTGLPSAPLGHGMGGTGVLAGLFSATTSGASAESGLGVIIAQLGVIGLAIFAVFFVLLTRASLALPDPRERVVAMTLLVGFALNAMFNEVALSPNSAAPYFVLLGLLIGTNGRRRNALTAATRPLRPSRPRLARPTADSR